MFPWNEEPKTYAGQLSQRTASYRPELQKDADGLYPGERETGFPDFLRRTRVSPASSLQASLPDWAPPWAAKS